MSLRIFEAPSAPIGSIPEKKLEGGSATGVSRRSLGVMSEQRISPRLAFRRLDEAVRAVRAKAGGSTRAEIQERLWEELRVRGIMPAPPVVDRLVDDIMPALVAPGECGSRPGAWVPPPNWPALASGWPARASVTSRCPGGIQGGALD